MGSALPKYGFRTSEAYLQLTDLQSVKLVFNSAKLIKQIKLIKLINQFSLFAFASARQKQKLKQKKGRGFVKKQGQIPPSAGRIHVATRN